MTPFSAHAALFVVASFFCLCLFCCCRFCLCSCLCTCPCGPRTSELKLHPVVSVANKACSVWSRVQEERHLSFIHQGEVVEFGASFRTQRRHHAHILVCCDTIDGGDMMRHEMALEMWNRQFSCVHQSVLLTSTSLNLHQI